MLSEYGTSVGSALGTAVLDAAERRAHVHMTRHKTVGVAEREALSLSLTS